MTVIKQEDWRTEALPTRTVTIELDRAYTAAEFETMRRGLKPEEMEDKWFIYWNDDALHFHRSWTGFCTYRVRFAQVGEGWRMVSADVNRDPQQYGQVDDSQDAAMIPYLIDLLLLRRPARYPHDDTPSDASALEEWAQVGRAMLGQHPGDGEADRGEPQEQEGADGADG